ncbi:MAG: ABC transporter permease [Polyangiaceae bacterium]|nr:ABC transporter permease [Polyangiaceae bacterium]
MARELTGSGGRRRVLRVTSRPLPIAAQAAELWAYRRLFWFLAWRDVKVRYKQTVVGVGWALAQPLATMGVFTFVFGTMAGLPSGGRPYALNTLAALVPWGFFATGLAAVSNSLVANGSLLRRAYFPRLVVPFSSLGITSVDFLVALGFLLGLAWTAGYPPAGRWLLLLPSFVVLAAFTAGVGIVFAVLNAMFRDVRHFVPFLTQLLLFATPVAYSSELVPERWRALLALNPLVSVMAGFRAAVLGAEPPGAELAWSMLSCAVVLTVAVLLFRRLELIVVDWI